MVDSLVESIVNFLGGKVSPEVISFIVSCFPVLELRGGLIAAKLMDVDFFRAFAICFIGNMLPIPFILLFIRKIFNLLKKNEKIDELIGKLEARSIRKADKVKKYRLWGLFLFVAIPLPGTGAWTGALIASLLNIDIKKASVAILIGVAMATTIVSLIMYGIL